MNTLPEILAGDNECSRLLRAFNEATGEPVSVRRKPWWLRLVSHPSLTVALGEQINCTDYRWEEPWMALPLVTHELRHIYDKRQIRERYGLVGRVLPTLQYAFPQVLAVLALLAPIHWAFLFALLFLAPWPAPWRLRAEAAGYAATRQTQRALKMKPHDYSDTLTSWKYWFPCWSRKEVRRQIFLHELRIGFVERLMVKTLSTYP